MPVFSKFVKRIDLVVNLNLDKLILRSYSRDRDISRIRSDLSPENTQ